MPMDNPPRTFTLFCWILDVSDRPFSISIEEARTVDDLKKAIMKEKSSTLANIEADQLTLWKSSIPIGTARITSIEVAKQTFIDNDALPEADPLSDHFPAPKPAKKTLHIVIRAPPIGLILELNCFIQGDDAGDVFPIKIARTESVGTLKDAIKDKMGVALQHVDANALKLRSVSIAVDDGFMENVKNTGLGDEDMLSPVDWLSDVFSKVPAQRHVHIIVVRPLPARPVTPQFDDENFEAGSKIFKHTPSKPRKEVTDVILGILDQYRPKMRILVAKAGKEQFLPIWIPKTGTGNPIEDVFRMHAEKLAIPIVNGEPSLLLHDLGNEESAINEKQAEHIAKVFSFYHNIVLINTSGSGKTRLGLQGLCQNWGFYAVIKSGVDSIGSEDFWQLAESLDTSLDYSRAESVDGYEEPAADHMEQKAHHRILQFLLARLLLLNLLIEEAVECGGVRPADHRLLWVLLQAQPIQMLEHDAFKEVAEALRVAPIEYLEQLIKKGYAKLKPHLELVHDPTTAQQKRRPLYCFLDEIQITTTYRIGQYWGTDKKTPRPFLRAIWSSLTRILKPTEMLVILSGTSIHSKSLQDVLESSLFKPYPYKVRRDIGAFDDANAQRQYIERYLSSDQSVAWEDFLRRAWGWCRGRYRSTATLVQQILLCGPRSPHSVLDRFVHKSTGFTPTDGEQLRVHEQQLVDLDMSVLGLWKFESLDQRQIETLCSVLYGQMVYGHYTLPAFTPEDDIEAFIEYGFARTRSGEQVVDEPLVIMAAWNWLEKKRHFSLLNFLQHDIGKHAPRNNGFEAYLAFYLRTVFEKTPSLDDVFTFRSDFARRKNIDLGWQSENFELVTVSIPAGSAEREISVVTPSGGPSSNVGVLASTDEKVLEWISENKGRYAICFPTTSAGPDFFFFVRSKATQRLLLVAVQAKNYQAVDKATLIHGMRSITPSWFWKSKKIEHQSLDDAPSLISDSASRFCDALLKIDPSITVKNASYPVLRVFVSWPAAADLERTLAVDAKPPMKKQKKSPAKVDLESVKIPDPDPHPLAAIHMENFNNNGNSFGKFWFQNVTEQWEPVFAKKQNPEQIRRSERLQNQ